MLVHIDLGALYAFEVKSNPLSTVSSASSRPRCPSTVPELTLKVFTTGEGGGGGTPVHYLFGYVPPKGVVILKLLI